MTTQVPLYAPLVLGLVLEPVRSAVSLACRRQIRRESMLGFAVEALNASPLQSSSVGATRACLPRRKGCFCRSAGLVSGYAAAVVLLALSSTRLGFGLVAGVVGVLLGAAMLGIIMQRRRQPYHRAVVAAMQRLACWIRVASVDQGEFLPRGPGVFICAR